MPDFVVAEQNLYSKMRDFSFRRKTGRFWKEPTGTSNDKGGQLQTSIQDKGLSVTVMSSFSGAAG